MQTKKDYLTSHQLFAPAIKRCIVTPLTIQPQPGKTINVTNTLLELEILTEIIPNDEIIIEEVDLP